MTDEVHRDNYSDHKHVSRGVTPSLPEDSFRSGDVDDETEQTRVPGWRLARLSDAEREVFVSIDENGLRPKDLVDHMNRTESTIRTLLSRARRKLNQ